MAYQQGDTNSRFNVNNLRTIEGVRSHLKGLLEEARDLPTIKQRRSELTDALPMFHFCRDWIEKGYWRERAAVLEETAQLAQVFGFGISPLKKPRMRAIRSSDNEIRLAGLRAAVSNEQLLASLDAWVVSYTSELKPREQNEIVLKAVILAEQSVFSSVREAAVELIFNAIMYGETDIVAGDRCSRFMVSMPAEKYPYIDREVRELLRVFILDEIKINATPEDTTIILEPLFQLVVWLAGERKLPDVALNLSYILDHNESLIRKARRAHVRYNIEPEEDWFLFHSTNYTIREALRKMGVNRDTFGGRLSEQPM